MPTDEPASREHRPRSTITTTPVFSGRRPRNSMLILLAVVVAAFLIYIWPPYLTFDPATSRIPLVKGLTSHYAFLIAHIAGSTVAIVCACFQMWGWLRRRHPRAHRITGRVYVFAGVLPGEVAALVLMVIKTNRDGVMQPGTIGLVITAVLWLFASFAGLWRARQGRYIEHRRWMTYSFALALTNIWNRPVILGVLALNPQVNLEPWLELVGWMPWILHLIVARWWLDRTSPARSSRARRTPRGTTAGTRPTLTDAPADA